MRKTEKTKLIDPEDGRHGEMDCCGLAFYDNWVRPLVAEFLGVLIFVFAGTMSVATGDVLTIAVAHGLAILFMAVSFAPISGAHLNPAVTFGVAIAGFIGPAKTVMYMLAQLVGAVAGAAITRGIMDQATYAITMGATPEVGPTTALAEALGLEVVLAFTLVLVFLVAQVDQENRLAPVAHGLIYITGVAISFTMSGGVLNMARSFGPSVIYSSETTDHWLEQWIYYAAGGIGAAIAAVSYKLTLASPERRWNCTEPKRMD